MADSSEKILEVEETRKGSVSWSHVSVSGYGRAAGRAGDHGNNSLLACGRKKAHHLHGQLEPLKVMLQVFSFNCETVLQNSHNRFTTPGSGSQTRLITRHRRAEEEWMTVDQQLHNVSGKRA